MMRAHVLALFVVVGCGSVPATPDARAELCYDGADNDGDGLADCEDPDCGPIARCVPDTPGQPAGLLVGADDPCPAGFTGGETIIHRGLQPSECTGCGCTPGDTECTANVWVYDDSNACFGDVSQSGGTPVDIPVTTDCSVNPVTYGQLMGIRAAMTATPSCTADGTGTPATSTWTESLKFCRAVSTGVGCAADQTCVPTSAPSGEVASLADGLAGCSGSATAENDWYDNYDDQRSCGACFCTGVGGDCSNVLVQIGSDYTCINTAQVGDHMINCVGGTGIYSPKAILIGTPTPPVGCDARAPISGMITATGQKTICRESP